VVVAIPAFNEEAVIERSVRAALASDWPDLRVIVVDDGSTDTTAQVVQDRFGADPRVTLIRQPNGGKWSAMNAAHAAATGADVVVGLDADAVLLPDALRLLVAHFADPAVGAVAGNVLVGNRINLLTRLQSLEYITAQQIDRRAAELLGAMLVVPGAVGAWRRAAVAQVGGYSPDTLTEDADLTVAIQRAGWRVVHEPRARSLIEAPQRARPLLRQRLRWTFGMMQTAWKHRRAARQGRAVGLVAIPDLWLAGVALGMLAPLADLVFLGVLVDIARDLAAGRPSDVAPHSLVMAAAWLALPLIEAVALLAALRLQRDESLWQVLLVPVQRLVYRPLLYITVWRAVLRAVFGSQVMWGKLARLGTVRAPGG
jgi:cellulose synthase/poly-beta-1,6-N-acetylglucosamine synthase-like glycosyltransferase